MSLPTEFFKTNRVALRETFKGTAPIIITANVLLQRSGDGVYEFRQDANFWYLTGLNYSGFVLVMEKDKEYLILPERPKFADVEDGPLDLDKIRTSSGIEEIYDHKEGWKKLGPRLKRLKHVAGLPKSPNYIKELGFYSNPARANLLKQIHKFNSDIDLISVAPQLAKLRSVKQEIELEALKKAIAITCEAINNAKKKLAKLTNESEIDGIIYSTYMKYQTKEAFRSIVASGSNATAIHRRDNDSPIGKNDLVVIDIGAEVERYSADITRTLAVSQPTKRQSQVYEAVLSSHQYALEVLKPGITIREFDKMVRHFLGEQLRVLGLIRNVDDQSIKKYFPHAIGHFLGLETHDVGLYDKPLEPNMVLAVEPGIYIPEEGIGIRIEDDLLITEDASKNLSVSLSWDLR